MSGQSGLRLLLAAAAVALLLAWQIGCEQVRPPQFPHRAHLVASECGEPGQPECASCPTCHGGLKTAEPEVRAPTSDCSRCHEPESDTVQAERVRLARATPRDRSIRFVHAEHLPLDEVRHQCVTCHTGVSHDGRQGSSYPSMPQCLTCHDELFRAGDCTSCHRGHAWRSQPPETFLRHDLRFLRDHRAAATRQAKLCGSCHAQSECVDCHDSSQTLPVAVRHADAVDRELIHRADFVTRHAIEARSQPAQCMRCHTPQSCDGCHVERGVSPARVGSVSPHPLGWVGSNTASSSFHGRTARRDVVGCAACHDRGPLTNCVRCHAVGAYGGNPHPSGWSSGRGEDDGMCRYCHAR